MLQTDFMNAITGIDFDAASDQSIKEAFKILTGFFKENPEMVSNASLAAFLPHSFKQNPFLQQTFHEIETVWSYVKKKFIDEPVWLDRYALGVSLLQLANEDDTAAAQMYIALKDPFAYLAEPSEADFRNRLLQEWEPQFNRVGAHFWEPESSFSPALSKALSIELPPVIALNLKTGFTKATGGMIFSDASGVKHTADITWTTAFAETAGTAVLGAIEAGLKELTQKLPAQFRSANTYHTEIQEILNTATRAKRQGELMWWLQSKYSLNKGLSYRTLSPLSGALQMTLDFARLTPVLAPAEVGAVLIESLWTTYPTSMDETKTLNDWINDVVGCPEAAEFGTSGRTEAPLLLCDVVAAKRNGKHEEASALAGVASETSMNLADLTLWLWRSLQVGSA